MIDVHDEVADLQVAQVGEERLREVAPLLGRAALLFEDIRLRVDLQAGIGQSKAARQRADGDEHRRGVRVLGALHGDRDDLVFLEDLDRPLRAAVAVGHEQDRLAALARLADLGDPVVDTAAELHRGLATHLAYGHRLVERELLEAWRRGNAPIQIVPGDKRLVGRQRHDVPARGGILVAGRELLTRLSAPAP